MDNFSILKILVDIAIDVLEFSDQDTSQYWMEASTPSCLYKIG